MPKPFEMEEDGLIRVRSHKGVWIYLRETRFAFALNAIDALDASPDNIPETPEADAEYEPISWVTKDSCEQAQKEIDRLLLCKAKAAQTLSLPVYTGDGKAARISGVHGRAIARTT